MPNSIAWIYDAPSIEKTYSVSTKHMENPQKIYTTLYTKWTVLPPDPNCASFNAYEYSHLNQLDYLNALN